MRAGAAFMAVGSLRSFCFDAPRLPEITNDNEWPDCHGSQESGQTGREVALGPQSPQPTARGHRTGLLHGPASLAPCGSAGSRRGTGRNTDGRGAHGARPGRQAGLLYLQARAFR
ncbi:hypothetical protein GCM10010324_27120 [Streptomyces hiroshimensis]|uniref:Secreted protein n=1 Tax=Streptomyces hiroshimensis TaxID=66424 RepID=A0ABQ2YFF0_9ACTN|nr:hypothetical protein GCM10010324_27120 [Streptomyces hiroshimensis]